MKTRNLAIRIIRGRDLAVFDVNGKSDPFCVLELDGVATPFKTNVKQRTLNPVWEETFIHKILSSLEGVATLRATLTVYDKDLVGGNEVMGRASFVVGPLKDGEEVLHWLILNQGGEVEIGLTARGFSTPEAHKMEPLEKPEEEPEKPKTIKPLKAEPPKPAVAPVISEVDKPMRHVIPREGGSSHADVPHVEAHASKEPAAAEKPKVYGTVFRLGAPWQPGLPQPEPKPHTDVLDVAAGLLGVVGAFIPERKPRQHYQ